MKTTTNIEKYELQIMSLMKAVDEIKRKIEHQEKIKIFCRNDPDSLLSAVVKLQSARIALGEAVGFLLEAGNKTHKTQPGRQSRMPQRDESL